MGCTRFGRAIQNPLDQVYIAPVSAIGVADGNDTIVGFRIWGRMAGQITLELSP